MGAGGWWCPVGASGAANLQIQQQQRDPFVVMMWVLSTMFRASGRCLLCKPMSSTWGLCEMCQISDVATEFARCAGSSIWMCWGGRKIRKVHLVLTCKWDRIACKTVESEWDYTKLSLEQCLVQVLQLMHVSAGWIAFWLLRAWPGCSRLVANQVLTGVV